MILLLRDDRLLTVTRRVGTNFCNKRKVRSAWEAAGVCPRKPNKGIVNIRTTADTAAIGGSAYVENAA